MTEAALARPALTHRRVLLIALPIVLSNATVPILGAVDTAVVGQLGLAAPIGAVGLGAVILSALYWIFGFLRMGTAGLTAQALGARDGAEVAALLSRVLIVAGLAGAAVIALQWPLFAAAFALAPASDEVEGLARGYLAVRVWSAPAAIAIYGVTGWLIAQERTRAVLVIQVWMNGLNIVLDVVFVLGFGWGVGGVAAATFLAEWAGLAVGLWFCRDALRAPAMRAWAQVFDRVRLARMAVVNGDIMIRSVLLQGVMVSFLFLSSDFGDTRLAANQVLLQFLYITAYALDGFAFAAESLVGQALGARARSALRRAALLTGGWGLGLGVALAAAFAAGGPTLIDLMTTAPDVRAAARDYLPWMLLMPVLGALSWMLDGVFIGATRTADMRNMMALSVAIYAAAVFLLVPTFANNGLWAALGICFVARGLTLLARYPSLERAADG
ncbi:MATE family efflux transporter [Meridianimarinicoccus roseus]|uniref:MATE family efflux transporter n=1 Tax=Meridianimarinicoccus roseus TaxID=2072018 RepID=A0A2V2L862_9RHOB|nr:MATE family efflux transporter [Meridianimarinicoccus roseus]PWR01502.1 MATE family efflux transporter [Meridianimarinicoccus roseus]